MGVAGQLPAVRSLEVVHRAAGSVNTTEQKKSQYHSLRSLEVASTANYQLLFSLPTDQLQES